jgi:DNA repair exonuclease SbcCD nuclease subunit
VQAEFIHTADLHLGSRLSTVGAESEEMQEKLQNATYSAFENIVDACIEEDVDFLVISGDLYDEDSRSVKANQFLANQMKKLQEQCIDAYIIHGNHDPMDKGEDFVNMPENVHVFDSEDPEVVDHNNEIEILGQSYRSRHETRKMVPHYNPDVSKISIGLLHTDLDPDNKDYVPVSLQDLENEEVDYWALGHIHETKIFEDNLAAYPGIPQGRHIEEKGVGGCLKVEVSKNSSTEVEFVPVSSICWREHEIDLEEGEYSKKHHIKSEIEEKVDGLEADFEKIEDKGLSVKYDGFELNQFIYRWFLKGRTEAHDRLKEENTAELLKQDLRNKLSSFKPLVWTEEVKIQTRPSLPNVGDIEDNDVIDGFEELVEQSESEPDFKEDLKSEAGKVWKETDNKESVREKELALTNHKLNELIDRAEKRLKDELLKRTV